MREPLQYYNSRNQIAGFIFAEDVLDFSLRFSNGLGEVLGVGEGSSGYEEVESSLWSVGARMDGPAGSMMMQWFFVCKWGTKREAEVALNRIKHAHLQRNQMQMAMAWGRPPWYERLWKLLKRGEG